ncbi:hypothetical protein ACP8HZ_05905 [Francisella noatunensis]
MAEFAEIIYLHRDNGFPIDTPANKRKLIKFYKQISTSQSISRRFKREVLTSFRGNIQI